MATGAKPALDPNAVNQTDATQQTEVKPTSLKDRIIHKLTEIFAYNERLGVTRQ